MLTNLLTRIAVRGALIGGSLATGSLFWVRATLGQNQLTMHDITKDGEISIGGVSEQLYGEGFIAAWHDVLSRELGPRADAALYEMGLRGARWEVKRAIDRGVWVPLLMRPLIGKPGLLERARSSAFFHAFVQESLRILFRMIMTEGGWGVVEEIDLRSAPARITVRNTPEPRRLGQTGRSSCHLMTGIYAGYLETIFGLPTVGVESRCACKGDPRCIFEITFGAPVDATARTGASATRAAPEPVAAA